MTAFEGDLARYITASLEQRPELLEEVLQVGRGRGVGGWCSWMLAGSASATGWWRVVQVQLGGGE